MWLASVSDSFLLTAGCFWQALSLLIIRNTETVIPVIALYFTLEFCIQCTVLKPVIDEKHDRICIISFLIIIFKQY